MVLVKECLFHAKPAVLATHKWVTAVAANQHPRTPCIDSTTLNWPFLTRHSNGRILDSIALYSEAEYLVPCPR